MSTSKIILIVLLALVLMVPACLILKTCNTAVKMQNDGMNTIYNQYKPSELLRKYEWFKDASAQLDQKLSTLRAYEPRFSSMKEGYGEDSLRRGKWSRTDAEQYNIWESEYLGVKASFNELAAQYNAQMAKFNYAFCNAGQLPQGATEVLPREFKPYINN